MFEYLIRVELHDEHDYAVFHAAMGKRGIGRTITDDNTGVVNDLPTGSYYVKTSSNRQEVVAAVQAAAEEVGRAAKIVVATTAGITWNGLDRHEMTLAEIILGARC